MKYIWSVCENIEFVQAYTQHTVHAYIWIIKESISEYTLRANVAPLTLISKLTAELESSTEPHVTMASQGDTK